jgi:hypothetical protein
MKHNGARFCHKCNHVSGLYYFGLENPKALPKGVTLKKVSVKEGDDIVTKDFCTDCIEKYSINDAILNKKND